MGRGRGKSSRAAETGEQLRVRRDDARETFGLWFGLPNVSFVAAADDDPVGTREHIARLAGEGVVDLGLRDQDGKLAADRDQVGIAEELARAKTGAVEDERFGERCDLGGRRSEEHTYELQSLMRTSYAVF